MLNPRAYSHQAKAGTKAKKIEEQAKMIKEYFRFRVHFRWYCTNHTNWKLGKNKLFTLLWHFEKNFRCREKRITEEISISIFAFVKCKLTLKPCFNGIDREEIRLLNGKTIDWDWYYCRHDQKLKLLIRDFVFMFFVKNRESHKRMRSS